MALSTPYAVSTFADVITMSTIKTRLVASQQLSGTGSGKIIVADLGPKYWVFDVSLINMEHDVARRVQALIEALDESMSDFYLYDPRAQFPIADDGGVLLGNATVQIASLVGNNKELTLKGLPSGYVLSAGDMLHFDFGSPARRALHRVVVGGAASGGALPIEVRPHLLPGAAVDAVVTLIKPAARVKIEPNSFDPGTARWMMTTGMAFKCRQVLG